MQVKAGLDDATFTIHAFVMKDVVRPLPRNPLPQELIQQLDKYKLADPTFSTATTIDMLIGIENYHDFVCQKRMKVANMWLQETIFGWTVSGKPFKRSPTPGVKAFTCFLTTHARGSDDFMQSQLHDARADLRQFERSCCQEDPPQPTKLHSTTEESHVDDYLGGADSTQDAIVLRADLTRAVSTMATKNRYAGHLGKITAVHPGKDGIAHTATVETATGSFKRPVDKLRPLPLKASVDEELATLGQGGAGCWC